MKYVISGREYPVINRHTAHVLHLMELKQQTRPFTDDGQGFGMKALQLIDEKAVEQDADAQIMAFAVMLFLTRRAAGDKVSFEEAASVGMADVEVIREPGDEPEPEPQGPTAPGGLETPEAPGDPAAEAVDVAATNTPSTT